MQKPESALWSFSGKLDRLNGILIPPAVVGAKRRSGTAPTEELRPKKEEQTMLKHTRVWALALFCLCFVIATPCMAGKVAISLPSDHDAYWTLGGEQMKRRLEAAGHEVDLRYANNDVNTQKAQLAELTAKRCGVLIVSPVAAASLKDSLARANAARIPVIAYDRLILDSVAVKYLVSFDHRALGRMQADFLRTTLQLDAGPVPVFMEFFAAPPSDPDAFLLFEGAMDVLIPYINSGKIRVKSREISREQCAVQALTVAAGRHRMASLLTTQGYGPGGYPLAAVLSPYDTLAQGIAEALLEAGYSAENFPLVTGQGCERASVRDILSGLQAVSLFKDPRTLADGAVLVADAVLRDLPVPIPPESTLHNGAVSLPVLYCPPVAVTLDNLRAVLVNGGFYTENELQ